MRPRLPSHATVVAYLALLVALGGTAYAALRVDSRDVVNDSLRSKDLADGKAVSGKDVRQNALSGEHIRENRLDAGKFAAFGQGSGGCSPVQATTSPCGEAVLRLETSSKVFTVTTGGYSRSSAPGPAHTRCELTIDGRVQSAASFGDGSTDAPVHDDLTRADGFALTAVSGVLSTGEHRVGLACSGTPHSRITDVTITAFAIGSFR